MGALACLSGLGWHRQDPTPSALVFFVLFRSTLTSHAIYSIQARCLWGSGWSRFLDNLQEEISKMGSPHCRWPWVHQQRSSLSPLPDPSPPGQDLWVACLVKCPPASTAGGGCLSPWLSWTYKIFYTINEIFKVIFRTERFASIWWQLLLWNSPNMHHFLVE